MNSHPHIETNQSSSASPSSVDQIVSDFDNVTFHISTPESKSKILVSITIKCWKELVTYGAQAILDREYGPYIVQPEQGYDFSVQVDLDTMASKPQEEKDELVRRVSLLKRNAMAAPFEQAFDEFASLQDQAKNYSSETAPQGVREGGEVRAIHYREEEAIYVKASHDRVTVIFSTVFKEETDRVYGKVFLQEFVDARKRGVQNAPQVLFRHDAPMELQGQPGLRGGRGENVGYVTFGKRRRVENPSLLSPVLYSSAKLTTPSLLPSSPLPPPPHPTETRRNHLPHSNLPRLLPLPHQSLQGLYSQPHAAADGRFPAGAQARAAGGGGCG